MGPVFFEITQVMDTAWNGGLKTALEAGGGIVAFLVSKEVITTVVGEFVAARVGDTYKKLVHRHTVRTTASRVRTLKIITVQPKKGTRFHEVAYREATTTQRTVTDTEASDGHANRRIKVTR
jgi:hypothetical protein